MTSDISSGMKDFSLDKTGKAKKDVYKRRNRNIIEYVLEDKKRAAAESGPDILTGCTYDSRDYRNRLNNRRKRRHWMYLIGGEDTREKIVKDMNKKFEDLFSNLNKLLREKDVNAVLGCDSEIFIGMLMVHKERFNMYKCDTLDKKNQTTRTRNIAFDRMLAHLDMIERYKRKMEGLEENEDQKDNKENEELEENDIPKKVGLKKQSLYLVYKSLEDNYKALNDTMRDLCRPPDNFEKEKDRNLERYFRDWYRAFLIISDETSRNMRQIFRIVSIPAVGRVLPEKETIERGVQEALKTSGTSQQEVQKLAKEYASAVRQYNYKQHVLENMVGTSYGKHLWKMHSKRTRGNKGMTFEFFDEDDYNYHTALGNRIERDNRIWITSVKLKPEDVDNASSDFVKKSKQVMELGRKIRDIVNNDRILLGYLGERLEIL